MDILIGADPELFVKKDGRFHSAHGLVPGNKKNPFLVKNGAVQVDGMALEFNIEPAKEKKEFVYNIESVLSSLREMVPSEYVFDFSAVAKFDSTHMSNQPREALEIGCEADFDAYTEEQKPPPIIPTTLRSAGGHIHIGWTEDEDPMESSHFLSCCQIARQLDYFLGIPSIILDKDDLRKPAYGEAGSFRPKSYGLEYRVLSNFWIKNKEYMEFVFTQTKLAFDVFVNKHFDYFIEYSHHASSIINTNDRVAAKHFVEGVNGIIGQYNIYEFVSNGKVVR